MLADIIETLGNFFGSPIVLGVLGLLFLGLIGLFVYIRMSKKEE
jgi:hypothetical protein